MKWDIILLVGFWMVFGSIVNFPDNGINFYTDDNGSRHYVLTTPAFVHQNTYSTIANILTVKFDDFWDTLMLNYLVDNVNFGLYSVVAFFVILYLAKWKYMIQSRELYHSKISALSNLVKTCICSGMKKPRSARDCVVILCNKTKWRVVNSIKIKHLFVFSFLFAILYMIPLTPEAEAAISFDAASSSQGITNSLTFSHTVTSNGDGKIIVVGVTTMEITVSGVTYGGQSLTQVVRANGNNADSEIWYLVDPPTGTNDVVVTLGSSDEINAGAVSFTGVNQNNPIDASNTNTGKSKNPSVSVTTTTDNALLLDVVATQQEDLSGKAGAGQTIRWVEDFQNNVEGASSTKETTTAGSFTMQWNLNNSVDWSISAIALQEGIFISASDQPTVTDNTLPLKTLSESDTPSVSDSVTLTLFKFTPNDAVAITELTKIIKPSGTIIPDISPPSGSSGIISYVPTTIAKPIHESTQIKVVGIPLVIERSGTVQCSASGCDISIKFSQADADAAGVSPQDIVIFEDRDDDDEFEIKLATTVTDLGGGSFEATATTFSDSTQHVLGEDIGQPVASGGGGGSGGVNPPSIQSGLHTSLDDHGKGLSGLIQGDNLLSLEEPKVLDVGEIQIFQFNISDDQGLNDIEHVSLYMNIRDGDSTRYQSDTFIQYDRFNKEPLTVNDPHGFFKGTERSKYAVDTDDPGTPIDFAISQEDASNLILKFKVIFSKSMDTSNLILYLYDTSRYSSQETYVNAITVVDKDEEMNETNENITSQEKTEKTRIIPESSESEKKQEPRIFDENSDPEPGVDVWTEEQRLAVEMWAGYHPESIPDSTFIDMVYLTPYGEDKIKPNYAIPSWVKDVAEWTVKEQISFKEFVNVIKYLHNNGLLLEN